MGACAAAGWQRAELAAAIEAVARSTGRDISIYDEAFLAKALEQQRRAASCATVAAYLRRLAQSGEEAETLSRSLRIVYSEFFRNPLAFALLEQMILPELVEEKARFSGSEIRVWSAGCAAGQEAWSVAILLDEIAAGRERPVPFRIFATDLSEEELALARAGVYDAASVGNVRKRHLDGCFSRHGATCAVAPRLRERVDFSTYDLLDPTTICPPASIFCGFDLVLCCNVLLYFRPQTQRFILDKLRRSLAPGGYLVAGEAERQLVESAGGYRVFVPPVAVFRKVAQPGRG
jgi:chemotaxis methyl-accepting protein methylase